MDLVGGSQGRAGPRSTGRSSLTPLPPHTCRRADTARAQPQGGGPWLQEVGWATHSVQRPQLHRPPLGSHCHTLSSEPGVQDTSGGQPLALWQEPRSSPLLAGCFANDNLSSSGSSSGCTGASESPLNQLFSCPEAGSRGPGPLLFTIFPHNLYLLNSFRTGPSVLPQGWHVGTHGQGRVRHHSPAVLPAFTKEAGLREGTGCLWAAQRGTGQDLNSFFASLISRSLPALTWGPDIWITASDLQQAG